MEALTGFKLIRLTEGIAYAILCPNGQIDYMPSVKYRHEKTSPFDPTIIHRRGKYHEDTFTLSVVLSPDNYRSLLSFLKADGDFFLEYLATPNQLQQFPVRLKEPPKCPDNLHEFVDKTQFTMISLYLITPPYFNYGLVASLEDDDIIVNQF
ncbi:MAG: hypothetical protein PHC50_03325 [Candidatus Cloacimonetes bacterium]|nr:hypothetical protein [Candidatus Cloacimonadota bacterium]